MLTKSTTGTVHRVKSENAHVTECCRSRVRGNWRKNGVGTFQQEDLCGQLTEASHE